jgi:hypothetical protein
MSSINLSEPISLDADSVNRAVSKVSPGIYALDATSSGPFKISYVGRSDTDLNSRLQSWIGKYRYFKAAYSSSPKAAFEGECHLYHDYKPSDNQVHPARPVNSGWECPRCTIFD